MASEDGASSIVFSFDDVSNIVNLDEVYDEDSDGTLQDDEFDDRFVTPTSDDVVFVRAQFRHSDPDNDVNTRLELDSHSFGGRTYKPGKTVELVNGSFLRINAVVHDINDQTVYLKGLVFRRNRELNGLVEFKRNEVTMLLEYDDNDPQDIYHQSIKSVQLDEIVRVRELIKTNLPFPQVSFREIDPNWRSQGQDFITQHGRLVCRTKLVQISENEGCLQVLEELDADDGYSIDSKELRQDFRGETERGGTCASWLNGEKTFDENELRRSQNIDPLHFHRLMDLPIDEHERRYTFGDAFCGTGGASRGAKAAGIRIDWGFDFDPAAVNSYSRNFFSTRCEAIAAHEFVTVIDEDFKVDILHLSPSCQTFSPYHVQPGQNDELNEATFLAIGELICKVKPRIVTIEETFGLTRTLENLDWFNAMIQVFTKLGFSVRWKVFNLCNFGLPQPRKRLFVFASCPGETLPDSPSPTHFKAADLHRFPGLSPFTTVDDAIARIPQGFPLYNPAQMPRCNKAPYAANLPLRRTICCAGNQDYHPSGLRNFTLRELACLQRFPLKHEFRPTRTRKQIGNAVPPIVAKVFFDHLRKHLIGVDGLA